MQGGIKEQYDCVKAFSETDFPEDLKKIDIPTLVMHDDDDQIVPLPDARALSAKQCLYKPMPSLISPSGQNRGVFVSTLRDGCVCVQARRLSWTL
jgi:hypothetical protein